ncbi:MAG: sulfur carrier protein ThiS [Chloroflexi bacterium]|nr:sulfur carrier protein ThiS [Chloroflexota bacterium]
MITLTVNGKPRELEEPMSLEQFLEEHGINSQFVAVAYNGTVLRRSEFSSVKLDQGDVLEVVRPVGGG